MEVRETASSATRDSGDVAGGSGDSGAATWRVEGGGGGAGGDWAAAAVPRYQPLACGAGHSAVLAADGALWTWGANQLGQCGQQRTDGDGEGSSGRKPSAVHSLAALAPGGCVQVACGAAHTLVLTKDGAVLGFGLNATGQVRVRVRVRDAKPKPKPKPEPNPYPYP